MAPRQQITKEKLEQLGLLTLVQLIEEQCQEDAVFRRKVMLMLADAGDSNKLSEQIGKRLKTIERSKSFIDWDKRKGLVQELENLQQLIEQKVAPRSAQDAAELMWSFVELGDKVLERVDDSSGIVGEIFQSAVRDLGKLWSQVANRHPKELANRVLCSLQQDAFGLKDDMLQAMGNALQPEGIAELQQQIELSLNNLPRERTDWKIESQRSNLVRHLCALADVQEDVDAFIRALGYLNQDRQVADAAEVAQRLLAANRAGEALEWLKMSQTVRSNNPAIWNLYIAAYEALQQPQAAQQKRWECFEMLLSHTHLRDYLQRLPDFEEVEVEDKALAYVSTHSDVHQALIFLLEWKHLWLVDQLVQRRWQELDGRNYELLTRTAHVLTEKFPYATTLVYRLMIESVLERANSKQYGYAARDLQECRRLAPLIGWEAGVENHQDFEARLQTIHGRKKAFWAKLEGA